MKKKGKYHIKELIELFNALAQRNQRNVHLVHQEDKECLAYQELTESLVNQVDMVLMAWRFNMDRNWESIRHVLHVHQGHQDFLEHRGHRVYKDHRECRESLVQVAILVLPDNLAQLVTSVKAAKLD